MTIQSGNYAIRPIRASERIAGGIIVPFNVVDKFDTWWTRSSDFALDLFRDRPVFWFHLLPSRADEHQWRRAGTVLDDSFEMRDEGLYAEARIDDEFMWNEIEAMRAAWSTGTMPNLAVIRGDGFVQRWPFVELSAAPRDLVGSLPGTTTAVVVRAEVPGLELFDGRLNRSVWVMSENGVVEFDKRLGTIEDTMKDVVDFLRVMEEKLESPAVQLPPEDEKLPEKKEEKGLRVVDGGYEWDKSTLRTQIFRAFFDDDARRDTRFMRSLMAKAEKELAYSDDDVESVSRGKSVAIRSLDEDAVKAVRPMIPMIRANEAMDLASYSGDTVETMFNSMAWYSFMMESRLFQQFPRFNMPSNPYDQTKITGGPTVRLVGSLTDQANFGVHNSIIPTSKITTDVVAWSAGHIGALTLLEDTLIEDAKINTWEAFARQYVRVHAQALDEVLLSGDETATTANISWEGVDPTGTAEDKILAVDGLRHMSLVTDANGQSIAGAIANDDILALLEGLGASGDLGLRVNECMLISHMGVFYDIAALTDYKSMSDVEALSTLVNGFLYNWRGVPIVPVDSTVLPLTTATGTIHSSIGNTLGQVILVHIPSIQIGIRRDLQIQRAEVMGALGSYIFSTMRFDVQKMETNAVVVGYNITV